MPFLENAIHIGNNYVKTASNVRPSITLAAIGLKSLNLVTNLFLCFLNLLYGSIVIVTIDAILALDFIFLKSLNNFIEARVKLRMLRIVKNRVSDKTC